MKNNDFLLNNLLEKSKYLEINCLLQSEENKILNIQKIDFNNNTEIIDIKYEPINLNPQRNINEGMIVDSRIINCKIFTQYPLLLYFINIENNENENYYIYFNNNICYLDYNNEKILLNII